MCTCSGKQEMRASVCSARRWYLPPHAAHELHVKCLPEGQHVRGLQSCACIRRFGVAVQQLLLTCCILWPTKGACQAASGQGRTCSIQQKIVSRIASSACKEAPAYLHCLWPPKGQTGQCRGPPLPAFYWEGSLAGAELPGLTESTPEGRDLMMYRAQNDA